MSAILRSFRSRKPQPRPARPALEALEDRAMPSASPFSPSGGAVAGQSNVVSQLLDTKVVAFDVTTTGALSFSLSTGEYSAKIELPGGMKLDTSALKALMSGQFALPKVEPVQAAAAFAGLKTAISTNYEQVRAGLFQQYGGGNVYLSTQRFTDWASPENMASTVGAAVVTGGSTSGQIIQEAKDVLLGELGNLYTWLKNKAPGEAEAVLAAALKGMVTGQDIDSPYVALKFVNVQQTYTIGLGGPAAAIAQGLGAGDTARSVTSTHKGFAIIWKGPGDSLSSLANSLDRFDGASMSGKGGLAGVLAKMFSRPELQGLGKLAQAVLTANPSAQAEQLVVGKLASALGLTQAQARQLYQPGNPIIDLRATALDERLAGLLGKLAAGNEGSARVTKLEFDLDTYEITAEVTVRHRHSWGSVSDILKAVGKQVGEWADRAGNHVEQRLDAAGNTVREVAHKASDKVTEVFDRAGNLLRKTVVNSAGYKVLEAAWKAGVKTMENVWSANGQKVSEYWRNGQKEFRNLYTSGVRTAHTVWENGVNTAHTTWNTAGQKVTDYWKSGSQAVSQWYTRGKLTAETTVRNGTKVAEKEWKDGVKTLDRVRDTAGRLVSEYWRDGAKEFRNLYTNGVRTAYSVWEKGVNTVHTTWNTARQKLTDYWRDGSREISQWFSNGKITAETIVQGRVKVAEKVWKDGVKTLDRVRDTAGKLVSEHWREGAKEFRNLYTGGVRTAYSAWVNGTNTVHTTWNRAGQKLTDYWRDGSREISQWFSNGRITAETIVQDRVKVAEKAWKDGVNTLNVVRDTAGRLVSEYWRDGAKEFVNYYQGGVRVAQNAWENGRQVAQHAWNTAGTYLGNALSGRGNAAKQFLGKVGIKI